MRELDHIGTMLCEYQADLFEQSVSLLNCSSAIFVQRFANSDAARRMDDTGFIFEATDTPACLDELKRESNLSIGSEKYPSYVMSWMGYMYRYLAYTRELSTKRVYSIIKPSEFYAVYEAYHSLDPEVATVRILESHGINPQEPIDYIGIAKKILL